MKGRKKIVKWLCFGVVYILWLTLQTSFFGKLTVAGAAPVLPVVFCASLGAFQGPKRGAAFGIFAGILADSLMGSVGFFTLFCTLTGFAAGALTEDVLSRGFGMAYICALVGLVATEIIRMGYYLFFQSLSAGAIAGHLLPELIYSAVLAIPIMLINGALSRRFVQRY